MSFFRAVVTVTRDFASINQFVPNNRSLVVDFIADFRYVFISVPLRVDGYWLSLVEPFAGCLIVIPKDGY